MLSHINDNGFITKRFCCKWFITCWEIQLPWINLVSFSQQWHPFGSFLSWQAECARYRNLQQSIWFIHNNLYPVQKSLCIFLLFPFCTCLANLVWQYKCDTHSSTSLQTLQKDTRPSHFQTDRHIVLDFSGQIGTLQRDVQDRGQERPPALTTVVPRHLVQQPTCKVKQPHVTLFNNLHVK
jgi:hypothetical protein